MEFHEKLQELRKSRNLTQEELAAALYVSRTAVSKWESGRGYPNMDSLKAIARYFSVTIDQLMGSEEIMTAAEDEKRDAARKYRSAICAALDLFAAVLLFLPVFGRGDGGDAAVWGLNAINPAVRIAFIAVIGLTVLNGVCGLIVGCFDRPVWSHHRVVTGVALSVVGTALFIAARQPYAGLVFFTLLVIKGILFIRGK